MSKKDFFILIIKLFGLYSIITSLFTTLPQSFSLVVSNFNLAWIIYLIVILAITIGLFVLLIFKSQSIVKILKLEKGFDDDKIESGNLTTIEIVKIGTFIIGGFLIIDNIPAFISQTINAFYTDIQSQALSANFISNWVIDGVNIIIGYLLITNLNFVVRLLRLKDSEK